MDASVRYTLHARAKKLSKSRGIPYLFLNTERGFGGKPPKKSGFRRHLAGSKMPKEGSKMPKATSRGSRSPEIKLHRRGRDLCCLRRGCGAFTAPCRLADERAVGTKSTFRLPHCEQSRCLVHSRDCGLGAVARGLPGRIGLDPMLTIAAPHDESDLGDGGPPHHWRAVIGFHLLAAARSPIAVGGADRRSDDDLDVRAQPPGLGGQILNLLARAGAGGEQHDTMAHDREVPTHASASINASEESSSPRPLANGLKAQARQALISIRRSA